MEVEVEHLKYPVALINNSDVGGFSSDSSLNICSEKAIDDNLMVGAEIVDSEGMKYVIKSVTKIKNANWLPSFMVTYGRRIAKVEYELYQDGQIPLDEFKRLVLDTLKGDSAFKESGLLNSIKGSETYVEVIECTGID
ncbi:hypothetical protein V4F62_004523 [Vibrio parahaemolyticus]|uniref:Uncharacterized protein n=1 Tax=Vibrio parahaemolyticus TaxID=670 RepID=A0A161BY13_VIBPH|nr:hypothetical protein [Vibrio parahaemolyticus]AKD43691.1 hypothetical protein [Vibrio parahaemolyticus]TOC52081.1 hypothetical protein CGJ88_09670 [Vibrio parahaemolyticus]